MDRMALGGIGEALANELEATSNQYHVKSSRHEILAWEAVGIRGMAKQLLSNEQYTYEISESSFLSDWGKGLNEELPELSQKVRNFRKHYESFKNT